MGRRNVLWRRADARRGDGGAVGAAMAARRIFESATTGIVDVQSQSNPHDETLDAPSSFDAPAPRHGVALVEGSSPALSGETAELLRGRLRAAALLMFAGYLAFLVRSLLTLDSIETPLQRVVFWCHIVVTTLTGLLATQLCRSCKMSLKKLRVAELMIFGAPALFFALVQYSQIEFVTSRGYVVAAPVAWHVLIFTYALFVPNTWRRAAVVIGILAVAPLAVGLYAWFTLPAFAELLRMEDFGGYFLQIALIMAVVAVTAVVGVQTIGTLRREAFEARQLGQYRLKQRIGSGGMGEVYLAEHQMIKRPCAVKVIRPDKAADLRVLTRFEREVQATARLTHWNTVEIFDYGRTDDGTFYYVMEYLPGLSLAELVEGHGPLPPARLIHLLTQTCDALSEAHAEGLVHRDLKPGNIYAAHRGGVYDVAKLLDFGLAKPLASVESSDLTQEGAITGSPLFMSPEQVTGDSELDARSDIYCMGAVAFFLLTGRPPFEGERAMKVMIAQAHEPPPSPSEFRPEAPQDLELVIMRCLAKHPDDRYQTTAELRAALSSCEAAGDWTRDDASHWWREYGCPRKRAIDAAALAAAGV